MDNFQDNLFTVSGLEDVKVANTNDTAVEDHIQEGVTKTDGPNSKGKKATSALKTPKEEEYKGVRKIVVYGIELFQEDDPKVSMESIRQRIVDEFHFPEFSKERTEMSLDKETGIVTPVIRFQKKG